MSNFCKDKTLRKVNYSLSVIQTDVVSRWCFSILTPKWTKFEKEGRQYKGVFIKYWG